ncbi:winged helix-turn-helix transcriptional regulator [Limosilactobacillus pontis]
MIDDQIVKRTDYSTMPPKVVYSLTAWGKRLKALLI